MNLEGVESRADSLPAGVERRDVPARAARDRLGAWLQVEPVRLREVKREPAETVVMLSDAFDIAASRVREQDELLRNLSQRLVALEAMVRTDHLTGIANRRAIDERLDMEWSRAARHGHDLAVIALDCDDLKSVNDTFGHAAGDSLLREVASTLQQVVRAEDLVGRVGGDEFMIVCPHTDNEGAALAARKITTILSAPRPEAPEGPAINISVGWAHARGQADWSELVSEADQALYHAKRDKHRTR